MRIMVHTLYSNDDETGDNMKRLYSILVVFVLVISSFIGTINITSGDANALPECDFR